MRVNGRTAAAAAAAAAPSVAAGVKPSAGPLRLGMCCEQYRWALSSSEPRAIDISCGFMLAQHTHVASESHLLIHNTYPVFSPTHKQTQPKNTHTPISRRRYQFSRNLPRPISGPSASPSQPNNTGHFNRSAEPPPTNQIYLMENIQIVGPCCVYVSHNKRTHMLHTSYLFGRAALDIDECTCGASTSEKFIVVVPSVADTHTHVRLDTEN